MLEDISYRFDEWPDRDGDPTGTIYSWDAKRSDMGWRYSFAGGASKDAQEGRERWVTDVYRWVQEGICIIWILVMILSKRLRLS
jgi:hypothetical protein